VKNWQDRCKNFGEAEPPELGQKLIWVKGGGARNRSEAPLDIVWFVQQNQYNWTVVDEDGHPHNVLPSRVYSEEEFVEWLDLQKGKVPPPQIAYMCPNVIRDDTMALKDLPEKLKEQLSPSFRERYEI